MTAALAVGLGLLIGLSLGALGGGGSILTVPVLVYVLDESARSATTASLVIVGITAAAAAVGHARAGHVRWRAGLAFGGAGVVASVLGTWLHARADPDLLMTCFAVLMLVAAAAMFGATPEEGPPSEGHVSGGSRTAVLTPARPGVAVALRVVAVGAVVGFLTGFLGVGGGFVIVPALVLTLRYDLPTAVGTSLLVISLNSGVALLARGGHESFHWAVIVPFTLAAIAGSVVGKRAADRVSGLQLTRAFGLLLLAVAGYVLIRVAAG